MPAKGLAFLISILQNRFFRSETMAEEKWV